MVKEEVVRGVRNRVRIFLSALVNCFSIAKYTEKKQFYHVLLVYRGILEVKTHSGFGEKNT